MKEDDVNEVGRDGGSFEKCGVFAGVHMSEADERVDIGGENCVR